MPKTSMPKPKAKTSGAMTGKSKVISSGRLGNVKPGSGKRALKAK